MEDQSERKAATAVPEEPVKAEGVVGSPDTSERSDGSASPPPNCSICLGKLINTSFTDSCLHQFCFTCLLQWSKIKTECPLCKQTFKSIIHNVRSEEDYDQYHVPRELASQVTAATLDVNFDIVRGVGTVGVGAIGGNWDIGVRRFMYRSTMGNPNRRMGVIINPHEVARREQIPSIAPQLSRDERRRRQINPSDFRRNVYRHGVWASPLPDFFGGFRECSAEFYRRHPGEISRLVPWLNREMQVLLNNNAPHVAYVLRIITEALSRFDIRSNEFRNLVRPYFGIHTEHFLHELVNFARTNFDMVGYDQSVIYLPSRGLSNEYVPRILSPVSSSSSMTSDDSDVRVVDEPVERRGLNIRFSAVMPHSIDMPGPSTIGRAFHPYTPYNAVPDVVTVSSSSGSEDECEVIGYVKPRHERTPEIIDLSNSETEEPNPQPNPNPNENIKPQIVHSFVDESQPSTSHEVKRLAVQKVENVYPSRMLEILSSSSSSLFDTDSDYSPKRKQKATRKKSKRSSQNPSPRKRKRSPITKSRIKTNRMLSPDSSSSESDSKHLKRTPKKEATKRRRISVSTDSSSEKSKKRNKKSKSRKIKHCSTVAPKDNKTLKRENIESNSDTESYSSSESDSEKKSRDQRKSRSYSSSSRDCSTERSRSSSKTKEKSREVRRSSNKSGTRHSRPKKCEIRSERATSYDSVGIDRSKLSQYPSCSDFSEERGSQEKTDLSTSETTTENGELLDKMLGYEETSTDPSVPDIEQHRYYRSRSQCSVCSDNTRTSSKKKSKHKDKRKEKTKKSSNKFFSSLDVNSISSSNVSSSSKTDGPSTSKYSDSKSSSSSRSRDKHRSHKKNKDSRRRRSRSNSRSKSKKKSTREIVIDFQYN